jgi:hypothetical protein
MTKRSERDCWEPPEHLVGEGRVSEAEALHLAEWAVALVWRCLDNRALAEQRVGLDGFDEDGFTDAMRRDEGVLAQLVGTVEAVELEAVVGAQGTREGKGGKVVANATIRQADVSAFVARARLTEAFEEDKGVGEGEVCVPALKAAFVSAGIPLNQSQEAAVESFYAGLGPDGTATPARSAKELVHRICGRSVRTQEYVERWLRERFPGVDVASLPFGLAMAILQRGRGREVTREGLARFFCEDVLASPAGDDTPE